MQGPRAGKLSFFGRAVATVPDVNTDGRVDVLVGAISETVAKTGGAGRAYLFSDSDASVIWAMKESPRRVCSFWRADNGIGDANGDGTTDVVVDARGEHRVYYLSGADGSALRTVASPQAKDESVFGENVSSVGDIDINGDETPTSPSQPPARPVGQTS